MTSEFGELKSIYQNKILDEEDKRIWGSVLRKEAHPVFTPRNRIEAMAVAHTVQSALYGSRWGYLNSNHPEISAGSHELIFRTVYTSLDPIQTDEKFFYEQIKLWNGLEGLGWKLSEFEHEYFSFVNDRPLRFRAAISKHLQKEHTMDKEYNEIGEVLDMLQGRLPRDYLIKNPQIIISLESGLLNFFDTARYGSSENDNMLYAANYHLVAASLFVFEHEIFRQVPSKERMQIVAPSLAKGVFVYGMRLDGLDYQNILGRHLFHGVPMRVIRSQEMVH